jgi:hypothetical protein
LPRRPCRQDTKTTFFISLDENVGQQAAPAKEISFHGKLSLHDIDTDARVVSVDTRQQILERIGIADRLYKRVVFISDGEYKFPSGHEAQHVLNRLEFVGYIIRDSLNLEPTSQAERDFIGDGAFDWHYDLTKVSEPHPAN